ncbi:SDR family NAD(P)-dependent oxidoreductase [Cryptosporangium aurantiacum]|uniref:NAD(P)-dependent dehydrogenase, short-chain alcohol dehydrogenase family n=1 Tax=Cryptosporangium aurantiacum TaxID=134849 RepID=A0A1M7TYS3_9ACTN|nr:SDR family NAD(P)-dependent oxidoreductase [Cryptosporangium aurantiacum]SHN75813.1 NAD(P)-dependent dehydrogenase, short-chain alcohol dehydrogenase family [Cryptosporangium aurantiacum]
MDEHRNAVVIGGASGIGRAIAAAFAANGYRVVVADRNAAQAADVAAELGPPHTSAEADVTVEASVEALFAQTPDPLDAVVNCAGISAFAPIVDHDADQFRAVVDTCLTGGFLVLKHAGRRLRPGGAAVSLSSLNARQPAAALSAYCAAKAGLSMLTQVAALEWGERGVRVNAIAPGLVLTPLTEPALGVPGVVEDYVENTPLGRPGTVEEIAAAALFLCSDQAAWITGEVLDINGGAHLKRYPDVLGHVTKAFG